MIWAIFYLPNYAIQNADDILPWLSQSWESAGFFKLTTEKSWIQPRAWKKKNS